MPDILPHLGKEGQVQALGQTWTLGRLEMDVWYDLLERFKKLLPDYYAGVDRLADKIAANPSLPMEHPLVQVFNREFSAARERADRIPSIESPEFQKWADESLEGKVEKFYLLLRKNHPDVTRDQAVSILREIGEAEEQKAILRAAGKMPPAGGDVAPAGLPFRPGR